MLYDPCLDHVQLNVLHFHLSMKYLEYSYRSLDKWWFSNINFEFTESKVKIVETIIRIISKIYAFVYTFLNKDWTNYTWYLDNWTKEYADHSSHYHMKILNSKKRGRLSEKMKWFTNEVYLNFSSNAKMLYISSFPILRSTSS